MLEFVDVGLGLLGTFTLSFLRFFNRLMELPDEPSEGQIDHTADQHDRGENIQVDLVKGLDDDAGKPRSHDVHQKCVKDIVGPDLYDRAALPDGGEDRDER